MCHLFIKEALDEIARLTCFESAEEGLREVPALSPDVILLDVAMPVMDGFEVCTLLIQLMIP